MAGSNQVVYTSRVRVKRKSGPMRLAYLPAEKEPVIFGSLDNGQRRACPELVSCGDHRTRGQRPGRALSGTDSRVRHTVIHAHRCAGDAGAKARLGKLSPEAVVTDRLAGEPIRNKLTRALGDGAPIDGLKVVTDNGWFAARPSGTENIYKIYAERDENRDVVD